MNQCIYTKKTESEATFESKEHIFPAGLGGIRKLSNGVVSDEANNKFSKIELEFMKDSPISINRQFIGPGRRGNIDDESKASKSRVYLICKDDNESEVGLGYIKKGKPYSIPQVKAIKNKFRESGEATCHMPPEKIDVEGFIEAIRTLKGKYKVIIDKIIPENEAIIGVDKERNGQVMYVAINSKKEESFALEVMEKITSSKSLKAGDANYNKYQPICKVSIGFDIENYLRVCSKVIFNYIAYCKGEEFVLKDIFDPIRNWILNGGENRFAKLLQNKSDKPNLLSSLLDKQEHFLYVTKIDRKLVGIISFYGNMNKVMVELSDEFDEDFFVEGYICDWENRNEFDVMELIKSKAN